MPPRNSGLDGNVAPLRAKHVTDKYDPHVSMTVSEFLIQAWKLS
jgi:hypothetical protein